MMITHSINLTQYDYLRKKQLKSPPASYVLAFAVTLKFHVSHEQHFLHIRISILTDSKEPLQVVKVPMKRIFIIIIFTYFLNIPFEIHDSKV